jgi:tetratricopeptide (TPR) repeat protein
MTHDPYSFCPCGSGKKLKWCCHDLSEEMVRVERLVEKDQPTAALKALERLGEKWPDNPWVLTVQTRLLWRSEQREKAAEVIERLLQAHPGHPTGLLLRALDLVEKDGLQPGLEPVQAALSAGNDFDQLSQLAVAVGLTLADQGELLAACAHVRLARHLHPNEETIGKLLRRVEQRTNEPEVLRDEYRLAQPVDVPAEHRAAFTEAVALSDRGAWLEAAERFEQMTQTLTDCKAVHYNLGLCRAWVLQSEQAVAALRRYVELESDFDAAVEVEALAQMLGEPPWGGPLDLLRVTYPLRDRDALVQAAEASELCHRVDATDEQDEDSNAPTYVLLDRPPGQWRDDLGPEELATPLGMFELLQRDTDEHGEIVRFSEVRDDQRRPSRESFEQIAGDAIGKPEQEETLEAAAGDPHPIQVRREFPERTTRQDFRRLVNLDRTRYLEGSWPNQKCARLDGRTPLEAADDPRNRVPLAAMVLLFGQAFHWDNAASTLQVLRNRLGLAPAERITVDEAQAEQLPLSRLGRLAAGELGDTALLNAFRRAAQFAVLPAVLRLGDELLRRDTMLQRIDLGMLCAELASVSNTLYETEAALGYIERGRGLDRRYDRDLCGFWDLQEIPLRLYALDREKVESLVRHTAEQHRDDASVQQALAQLLANFGLLRQRAPEEADEPAIVVPGGGQPGRIWTPEQDESRRDAPKIWTPGDA